MPASTTAPKLSGAALRKLRALGHSLAAVVAVGKDGLTDSLVAAVDAAIGTHELVKVKIQREAPVDRHEAGIELAARTGSVLAQVIGRTLLLYRRHPKRPQIDLSTPRATAAGKTSPSKARRDANRSANVSAEAVESDAEFEVDPEENP
jgi:RNA-binding protein